MRKARGWRRGMAVVLSVGMGGALAMTASAAGWTDIRLMKSWFLQMRQH